MRQAEALRQVSARVDDVGGSQDVVVHAAGVALERHLRVRVERLVVLTDARHLRHVPLRVGDDSHLLDGQEVAEAERAEAMNVVNAELVALLNLDVDARRRQDVVRDEVEVLKVPCADRWDDVLVGSHTLGAARRRDVQNLGARGIWCAGRDEHDDRRVLVIRHEHLPHRRVCEVDILEEVLLTVALEQVDARYESLATVVDEKDLVDAVHRHLLELLTVLPGTRALAGRRWRAVGIVLLRTGLDGPLETEVRRQLVQLVGRSDVNLPRQDVGNQVLERPGVRGIHKLVSEFRGAAVDAQCAEINKPEERRHSVDL